jgi:tetratricopeptide (TPR) repeat protein
MPLANPDAQRLRSAHGYLELGMLQEANAELEEIDPLSRHLPEVLQARLAIYRELRKWDLMLVVAKKLVEWNPKEPANFVDWAYAARRAESIHIGHAILKQAAELHPAYALIQFNLACYEAQLGNIDRAKTHLSRATKLDGQFSRLAIDDPDLQPLWQSFSD